MEDSKEYKGVFTIADAIEATAEDLEELKDTLRDWIFDDTDPNDGENYKDCEKKTALCDHVLRWLVELRDIKNGELGARLEESYKNGFTDGQKATAPVKRKYKYIVVRSYTENSQTKAKKLEDALKNGFEFVRASELIESHGGYCDYIEYILRKEVNEGGET